MKHGPATMALAALISLTAAPDAAAQLGKLKKAATDKAAQAAGVPTKAPVMVDRIGLTTADLKALEAGISAELAAAPGILRQAEEDQKNREKAQEKYSKDYEAYQKASEKFTTCRDKLVAKERPQEEALEKKHEAEVKKADMGESEQAALEAQAMKAQEAAQKVANGTATAEDRKTLQEFQQMAAGLSTRGTAPMASANELTEFQKGQLGRITASCGAEPQAPKSPGGGAQMASEQIKDAGAKASGMDARQYVLKREELIGLCGSGAMVAPASPNSSELNDGLKAACPKVAEMQKAGVPI